MGDYRAVYAQYAKARRSVLSRDVYIQNNRNTLEALWLTNPSSKLVRINDKTEEQWVWIVDDTKSAYKKEILMPPDEVVDAGDIIHWNDAEWMCIMADRVDDEISISGYIEHINAELKWFDDECRIHRYPTVITNHSRSSREVSSEKVMELPNGRRVAVVKKDEHTLKIRRDKFNRFVIEGVPFRVVSIDNISLPNLISFTIEEVQYDSQIDDLEKNIVYTEKCSMIDYIIPPKDSDNYIAIKGMGSVPHVLKKGMYQTYTAIATVDGKVEDIPVMWEILDENGQPTDKAEFLEIDGNRCVVKANSDSGTIYLRCYQIIESGIYDENSVIPDGYMYPNVIFDGDEPDIAIYDWLFAVSEIPRLDSRFEIKLDKLF